MDGWEREEEEEEVLVDWEGEGGEGRGVKVWFGFCFDMEIGIGILGGLLFITSHRWSTYRSGRNLHCGSGFERELRESDCFCIEWREREREMLNWISLLLVFLSTVAIIII